jgi:salicylate hydroxylase
MNRYNSPFWGMHRVDLQRVMADRCRKLGVVLRLSSKVVKVDFANAEVEIEGSDPVNGDVVVCADGLWSAIRGQFLERESKAILTGDLAYRIVIKTDDLAGPDAEELTAWIKSAAVNFWAGPKTHIVAYTMRAGSMFNIVLLCPDNLPAEVTKTEGDLEEMKALFVGWDPILRKFLEQVKGVAKWKLMHLETLPEWANKEGTFMMVGDCCHPMLPYLAQGANSSLEDGAVLGFLLGKVGRGKKREQLPAVAKMYQKLRKERGELIAKETFKQREDFHLEDGERQKERDRFMEECLEEGEPRADFPSRWTCPRVQKWLYGYDAYEEVEAAWDNENF